MTGAPITDPESIQATVSKQEYDVLLDELATAERRNERADTLVADLEVAIKNYYAGKS